MRRTLVIILLSVWKERTAHYTCDAFHAYSPTKLALSQGNISTDCPSFGDATKPYPANFYKKLSLWDGLMNRSGETLYGSEIGLEAIWRNQNPPDCLKAKYIISGGWSFGFGSRLHFETVGLAIAMQLGRVYLPHPDGDSLHWETKNPFCETLQMNNGLGCYYEQWSSCNMTHVLHGARPGYDVNSLPNLDTLTFQNIFDSEAQRQEMIKKYDGIPSFNMALHDHKGQKERAYIPFEVRHILFNCSPVLDHARHYWWRAVALTYLLRPNKETSALLANYSTLSIPDFEQCIAMYVRHGDKSVEMKLVDLQTYLNSATALWRRGLKPVSYSTISAPSITGREGEGYNNLSNSNSNSNGTIFLGTEDPAVLSEATEWGRSNGWNIAFTNLFDRAEVSAKESWAGKRGKAEVHHPLEYLSMILNLQYALKSQAWVCTLASNFCRVIDELRATVGAKANHLFVDLSSETCARPPCVGDGIWDFQFRYRRLEK